MGFIVTNLSYPNIGITHGGAMDKRRQVRPELDQVVLPPSSLANQVRLELFVLVLGLRIFMRR